MQTLLESLTVSVMPEQAISRRKLTPEQHLAAGVIEQALGDLGGSDPEQRTTARRFFADHGDDSPLAYWCAYLGWDAAAIGESALKSLDTTTGNVR